MYLYDGLPVRRSTFVTIATSRQSGIATCLATIDGLEVRRTGNRTAPFSGDSRIFQKSAEPREPLS